MNDLNHDSAKPIKASLFFMDFDLANEPLLNQIIFDHILNQREHCLVTANLNLHALHELDNSPLMKNYLQAAEITWLDGMPLVFMFKLLGYPVDSTWRITFLDWQNSFFHRANQLSLKVMLLGSTAESVKQCCENLSSQYPQIKFAYHHGYLSDPLTNQQAVQLENSFSPDILLMGMGMPLQEEWAYDHLDKLSAKVILPLGGYFDYISGHSNTPPRWTGRYGLEWLWRLAYSPKRLAHRYLIEPIPIILKFALTILKPGKR